jgi:hypothetical protein
MKGRLIALIVAICGGGPLSPSPVRADTDLALTNSDAVGLIKLRDNFVHQTRAEGLHCHLAPPKLVLSPTAGWGNYDSDANSLTTPLWTQLRSDDKSLFFGLAGPNTNEDAAHTEYELAVHRWIFVHEMGHWVQHCERRTKGLSHYRIEFGANRIAMAYWREHDPALVAHLTVEFRAVVQSPRRPLPPGANPEVYFNEHYSELTGTPQYTWFQSEMVTRAHDEQPVQSLRQALQEWSSPATPISP